MDTLPLLMVGLVGVVAATGVVAASGDPTGVQFAETFGPLVDHASGVCEQVTGHDHAAHHGEGGGHCQ